jgi:hypothetical protein
MLISYHGPNLNGLEYYVGNSLGAIAFLNHLVYVINGSMTCGTHLCYSQLHI